MKKIISELYDMKMKVVMLTGDNNETAKMIADELNIKEVISNVSPKEKLEKVKELNKNIVGKVFSDHPNGGTILKDVKGYASEGTKKSMKEGTIHNLVTGFEKSFNGAFAKEFHKITDVLKDEKANIGGFELKITYHEENIEIEFPQIGCVYTHMLGHDCHSIVAGEGHANVIIAQLKRYKENGYNLVLSSHYTPETLKDVDTKIAYL